MAVARATRPGYHADGAGLYLRVGPTGGKSWAYRYRSRGPLHDVGLGPLHTLTLAEARSKALELRRQRLAGEDPRTKRRQQRLAAAGAVSFRECAERYIAAHEAGWRNPKHRAQWRSTLEAYAYPVFGDLPVEVVEVGLVMKAIEPIWTKKPETASRVRGRVESILDWATARGYRQGENPARWRGHLENLLPKKSKVRRVEHHAALPYTEIGSFVAELRQQDGVAARALEFLILTVARTGEVIGGRPKEVDFAQRLWVVPGERMKAGREHRVPLCHRSIEILEEMQTIRDGDFLFPGGKVGALSDMAMAMTLRRMGHGDLTVHGFRSTFSDWCAEQTNFRPKCAKWPWPMP